MEFIEPPSKEELEHLYIEKGREALVWYAWRNALRALPLINSKPFKDLWDSYEVNKVFNICRIPLLMANISKTSDAYFNEVSSRQLSDSTALKASRDIKFPDDRSVSDDLAFVASLSCASIHFAYKSGASSPAKVPGKDSLGRPVEVPTMGGENYSMAFEAYNNARNAYELFSFTRVSGRSNPIIEGSIENAQDLNNLFFDAAARSDFEFLINSKFTYKNYWLSQPIWPKYKDKSTKPCFFAEISKKLLDELVSIDLDFIADDIKKIWEKLSIGSHFENYFINVSTTEANDPITLKKIIKEGADFSQLKAVRVLLLGPGGAGKTSLASCIKREQPKVGNNATPGIDFSDHKPLTFSSSENSKDNRNLSLYLWDFGGQTIFHGLHNAFLHENCIYVLVVDSRHEQAPDNWLNYIRDITNDNAHVFLVTNIYENCIVKQNENRLLHEFPNILKSSSFYYFSCLEPDSREVKKFILNLVQSSWESQYSILKETFDIYEELAKKYEKNYIVNEEELIRLIAKYSTNDVDNIIYKLEQLGMVFRVNKNSEYFFTNIKWVIDNVFGLINSHELHYKNGVIARSELIPDSIHKKRDALKMLDFLIDKGVCKKTDDDKYFFPEVSSFNEPSYLSRECDKDFLQLRFDLPYFPVGLHSGVVCDLYNKKRDIGIFSVDEIWREGFILRKTDSQSNAVVRYRFNQNKIELNLCGELNDFSELLSVFYNKLKDRVTKCNINDVDINPWVILNNDVFSLHSSEKFIQVLEQCPTFSNLIDEIKKMSKHTHINMINSQYSKNSPGSVQKYQSDNVSYPSMNNEQKEIFDHVLNQALKNNSSDLNADSLLVISELKAFMSDPERFPSHTEAESIFKKVYGGLVEMTGFTADVISVGQFITNHSDKINALVTTAIVALKSI